MADEPTPSELARLIERNHKETSADIAELKTQSARDIQTLIQQMERYVLAKVYEVEMRAFGARIQRMEDNESSNRRWRLGLLAATLAAVLGAIVTVVGTVLTSGGAGH